MSSDDNDLIDLEGFLPPEKMRSGRMMQRRFRHIDEWGKGQDFLLAMKLDCSTLVATANDPPDLEFKLDGCRIGIELVELIDVEALKMREQVKKRGNVDLAALRKREFWSKEDFQNRLTNTIKKKEEHKPLASIVSNFDKLWLFVHTSEESLSSVYVIDHLSNFCIQSRFFSKIMLKLEYEPGFKQSVNGHPIYEVNLSQ